MSKETYENFNAPLTDEELKRLGFEINTTDSWVAYLPLVQSKVWNLPELNLFERPSPSTLFGMLCKAQNRETKRSLIQGLQSHLKNL